MIKKRFLLLCIFASVILITTLAHADITGKVVGVADGDTITVLENRTQYKIRLFGVDCPESPKISETGPNNSHLTLYSAKWFGLYRKIRTDMAARSER